MSRPEGAPSRLGIVFKALLLLALAALLGLIAMLPLSAGFASLREARQLERTPRSLAATVLPGEVTLQGRAVASDGTLTAPDSGAPTLYFDYTLERKKTDSEGKTRWETVDHRVEWLPFVLADESGEIPVHPSGRVDFGAEVRHSRQEGDLRWTERRIDAGDTVFVFGYVDGGRDAPRVGFESEGQYSPIVSTRGEADAHSGFTGATLFLLWLGLLVLSFAVFSTLWGLRLHQVTGYLAILSLTMAATLLVLSFKTASDDLRASFTRTLRDVVSGQEAIMQGLRSRGVDWDGDWRTLSTQLANAPLDAQERGLLEHMQVRFATQVERTARIRRQWPERLVAGTLKLPGLPEIPLPAGQTLPARAEDAAGPVIGWAIATFALLLTAVVAVFGFRRVRLKRLIENLATTRIAGVAYGLAELKARAMLAPRDEALVGPLSQRPSVWYRYKVEERRRSGKNSRWVTIEDRRVDRRFWLVDDEGQLPVEPEGADAIVTCRLRKREGRMRYTEHWIEPGTPVYALGSAVIDPRTGSSLALCRGEPSQPFLLSDLDEPALLLRKARSGFLLLNLATNLGNAAALAMLGASLSLDGAGFLLAALAPLAFFLVFMAVMLYNDLVTLRQRVRLAWSNIEVSLMKRADLVPQLESAFRAFLAHERQLQEQLTAMRSLTAHGGLDLASAGRLVGAEQDVIARVAGLVERHPELKSSPLALQLSAALVRLDNEVALMREGYNNAVERYNTRSQGFPGLVFARLFAFAPAAPFQAEMSVHRVPSVAATTDGVGAVA